MSKQDTEESTGSSMSTQRPLPKSFMTELHRSSYQYHPSQDPNGCNNEKSEDGENFLVRFTVKPLPEQNESGIMSNMRIPDEIDFEEWVSFGIRKGFCGPPVCEVHDGFPMSAEEWAISEVDGEPPCLHMVRLYNDDQHKAEVEDAHSPSVWRQHGYEL